VSVVRRLTPADRPAVERICMHSFESGWDYIPQVFDAWLADPSPFYGVFEDGATLLGIGRVRLLDAGATAWCEGDRVDLEHRRRGVGRDLLAYAANWAREHGARRLRAAVYSENAASMRLFTSVGFGEFARFERWDTGSAGAGRLPRPLPIDEIDQAMAFIGRSIPYRAARGTYAPGWTIYDLNEERLALHLERQEVLLAGDSIGALAIVTDFAPGGTSRPTISFLCGAPVAVTRLLHGIRMLARLRGIDGIRAHVAHGSNLEGMLSHAGFARGEGDIVVQERGL
jgi:GNAT superfamily N-acetyltransferase